MFDEHHRLLQDAWMNPDAVRLYTVLRTDLHRALADAARAGGAEVMTGSTVASATPDVELVLANGRRSRADLVIGADVRSPVRDSLGLARRVDDLQDGCGRHLIPRLADDPVGRTLEY